MENDRWFHVPAQYQLPGAHGMGTGVEFLALPKRDIPTLVSHYLEEIETGTTEQWCQCVWTTHPDDVDVQAGQCRDCLHANAVHNGEENSCSKEACECVEYRSRRVRKLNDSAECPMHTRTGLIMGFYEHLFRNKLTYEVDKRSPEEWLASPEFQRTKIIDNNGWTYSEWMKRTPITREEFEKRLERCTISVRDL